MHSIEIGDQFTFVTCLSAAVSLEYGCHFVGRLALSAYAVVMITLHFASFTLCYIYIYKPHHSPYVTSWNHDVLF